MHSDLTNKGKSGVAFSVPDRQSRHCERPTAGSDEGNSSKDLSTRNVFPVLNNP
jgi:hypothetical protein